MVEQSVCQRCGQPLKSHESISVANVGLRCYRCFNEETAAMMGVDFDNTPLQPVIVSDADGVEHTFEFRSRLVPTGHALYARERMPEWQEGYEFSVLGDFDANVWDLFRVLYDRIRHELAVRHVEQGELGWRITDARHLVGRIAGFLLPAVRTGRRRTARRRGLVTSTSARRSAPRTTRISRW